jgi:hypothetical protein
LRWLAANDARLLVGGRGHAISARKLFGFANANAWIEGRTRASSAHFDKHLSQNAGEAASLDITLHRLI